MICRCFGRSFDAGALLATAGRAARLMAGVADYDAYLAHMAENHPGQTPMDRAAFVRDRQAARYEAGGGLRCC